MPVNVPVPPEPPTVIVVEPPLHNMVPGVADIVTAAGFAMVIDAVALHELASSTKKLYAPALTPVKVTVDENGPVEPRSLETSVKPPVPPEPVKVTVVVPSLQSIGDALTDAVTAEEGAVTVTDAVAVQTIASVTV